MVMVNGYPDLAWRHGFADLPVLVVDGVAVSAEGLDE